MTGFILVFLFLVWHSVVYPGIELNDQATVMTTLAVILSGIDLFMRLNGK